MTQSVRRLTACRLCNGSVLVPFADFGVVPLGNDLRKTADAARAAPEFPLDLVRCSDCSHFQLGHVVAPDLLYATNYTYLSGIAPSFVRHFTDYADWAIEKTGLAPGALVVDVGSNDGSCLKAFQSRGSVVCGVDPASLAAGIANDGGVETITGFFDEAAVEEIVRKHGHPAFVTSHNVLAHVDDLAATFGNIHMLLKDGGYFGFEVGYFREVLRTGCFDTTYHEHLDYHHAAPLARHLTGLGFELVDLSVNSIQGGSLRLLFRKTGTGALSEQAASFLTDERRSVLYDDQFLSGWKQRIERTMDTFHDAVAQRRAAGKSIFAYGAPTKATLLLKTARLGEHEIDAVAEDNRHKVGCFLPGSAIPIVSTATLLERRPDVIVIFAWNFASDILAKLRAAGVTGEAVIPLPDLEVVKL